MKTLKFTSDQVNDIQDGKRTTTWRLYDDKQLDVGDYVQFINSSNNHIIGYSLIDQIIIKRISELNEDDKNGNESYQNIDDIIATFRHFYGPNVSPDSVIKVIKYQFFGDKLPNKDVFNTTKITEVKLYSDGGSRGNPGPSATGFVITDSADNVIKVGGDYLGITTNNQAEYQAVRQGLISAEKLNARVVCVYMDSLLVVNQMNGIFKIKNRELWPIHKDICDQIKRFERVTFMHIPREMNKKADEQVNKILDSQQKDGPQSELL